MKKPTEEQVDNYFKSIGVEGQAAIFMDHYDSCGWVVGKNKPMKDWEAACRQWKRRMGIFAPKPANKSLTQFVMGV